MSETDTVPARTFDVLTGTFFSEANPAPAAIAGVFSAMAKTYTVTTNADNCYSKFYMLD